ncbi:response regulator [Clostridium sp. Ade.TY]|uniref:response regulator n=1 Tax=Clostridium sp. Ade.TY TaxID=1391647 RepID=UPI00040A5506|nr:response regulator [Clostridium sp. Ade.TY]
MFKVMIVDDENLEKEALKVILGTIKNLKIVAEASNGREAIDLDKKYNPDLIIMDVKMPGIDGCKATEIIKAYNKDKIIIMVTAYDDLNIVRKALSLGVDDYILKPINPQKIYGLIENIIVNYKINDSYELNNIVHDKEVNKKNLSSNNNQIISAIDYIEDNFKENITLDKIAATCNLSPCYFSKLFKKEMGINFNTYLNNKKIEYAKEILKTTDTPILNIALDLGFDDCGYFIKVFKKVEGVTPKKYREII